MYITDAMIIVNTFKNDNKKYFKNLQNIHSVSVDLFL